MTDKESPISKNMNENNNITINNKPKNKFTNREDTLLLELRSIQNLSWKEIAQNKYFPNKKYNQLHSRFNRIRKDLNKGEWSKEEDKKLLNLYNEHSDNWKTIAKTLKNRNSKQIRDRYNNYLKPEINHTKFTIEEDDFIMKKYNEIGPKWVQIAKEMPNNRTSEKVKNRFYCKKKKVDRENKKLLHYNSKNNNNNINISNFNSNLIGKKRICKTKNNIYNKNCNISFGNTNNNKTFKITKSLDKLKEKQEKIKESFSTDPNFDNMNIEVLLIEDANNKKVNDINNTFNSLNNNIYKYKHTLFSISKDYSNRQTSTKFPSDSYVCDVNNIPNNNYNNNIDINNIYINNNNQYELNNYILNNNQPNNNNNNSLNDYSNNYKLSDNNHSSDKSNNTSNKNYSMINDIFNQSNSK